MTEHDSLRQTLKKLPGASALSGGADRMLDAHQHRLDAMQELLESHEQSLRSLTAAVHSLEQHLPDLLNTIASGHGFQRALTRNLDAVQVDLQQQIAATTPQIGQLWERVEMVRKEILFELRYGAGAERPGAVGSGDRGDGLPSEARVIDEAKVARSLDEGLRLNLGCGHIALDGYVNVDMRELPGVDVVAPVDDLPFEDRAVAEIFSAHVLEHFPVEELRRRLLPYWISKLAPGATFRAVVPDADAMIRRYGAGEMPYEQLREVFFGGQEYEGDFHFNMFTAASLAELLTAVGLDDVRVEASDRPNGQCFELQIAATVAA